MSSCFFIDSYNFDKVSDRINTSESVEIDVDSSDLDAPRSDQINVDLSPWCNLSHREFLIARTLKYMSTAGFTSLAHPFDYCFQFWMIKTSTYRIVNTDYASVTEYFVKE